MSGRDLFIAQYDEYSGKWIELDCVVDVIHRSITAEISHFSSLAILYMRPEPASLTITDLVVSPDKLDVGERVTISVAVYNTGDLTGSYEVALKIDDVIMQIEEVTLPGSATRDVVFSVSRDDVGSYSVDVNGLSDLFTVEELIPVRSQPETAPSSPVIKVTNWWLIVSISISILVVSLVLYFITTR